MIVIEPFLLLSKPVVILGECLLLHDFLLLYKKLHSKDIFPGIGISFV